MKNPMFRYLEKYVGTYRVLTEYDHVANDFPRDKKGSIDESFDELYIPCNKGIIKHSYKKCYLVWYTNKVNTGRSVYKKFQNAGIDVAEYEETSADVLIWFNESYMKKVAAIVKPKTTGKGIKPFSKRNIESKGKVEKYIIPEKDLKMYSDIIKDLSTTDKMHFSRYISKQFDDIVNKIKGSNYNCKEEKNNSGLPYKEFIHSIGMWEEFIKYSKKAYKEYIKE